MPRRPVIRFLNEIPALTPTLEEINALKTKWEDYMTSPGGQQRELSTALREFFNKYGKYTFEVLLFSHREITKEHHPTLNSVCQEMKERKKTLAWFFGR